MSTSIGQEYRKTLKLKCQSAQYARSAKEAISKSRSTNLHEIPERPWEKLAADIFTFGKYDYLVVVDYYSKFPEFTKLESKTAGCVIMKMIFSRQGIPETLIADNVPFPLAEFEQFATERNFTVVT